MVQYFTEKGPTYNEVIEIIKKKYGKNARVMTYKTVPHGGILGLFSKDWVEVSGYVRYDIGNQQINIEDEKRKILQSIKREENSSIEDVLKEVKSLKTELAHKKENINHPTITKIEDILRENDFSENYIKDINEFIKREFSLSDLDDYERVREDVVLYIAKTIKCSGSIIDDLKKRVFILVGPTGVGKTTTIAKLAAIYGINGESKSLNIKIITIDNYRIGAKKQIQTYGDIMGIPVRAIESFKDLKDEITDSKDFDLILVDTIGKSPKDFMKLAEMKELLNACGRDAEFHLAVSSTTKTSDVKEIFHQFSPFNYKTVIFTKVDETTCVGNLISLIYEMNKVVSYVTDGQIVPHNISVAEPLTFIRRINGYRISDDAEFIKKIKSKSYY
ncbi:flagellar biosynthesis protein FlhF [Borreliella lusitaniae]|uniref:Flagellar biosynthesis protein FlhF n=1 Tax=Borreliella lusitaniae TaxID=100177 RepID=A0ABZ0CHN9_9SPIR|nr:flagellar biosynthesis protein FlhF [Borreliella lusitaniae]WKC85204.1 flagellar biosynthesis protein FlhF [Borreliella lusitaniae]WNY67179.1 flagellar biosynthesis protein FlhF [Borreliella lusitaniae]WNY68493.1 flagellar biosynthesis protein FlhF [Borreliella lusitaniae]